MPKWNFQFSIFNFQFISSGFTLIEVLVVIVTMVLIFMVGFANFRGTQKTQELSNATSSIKTDLRFAQELALAGKKPTGCTTLNGFIFDSTASNKYKIVANCNSPATNIEVVAEKDIPTLYPSVTLNTFTDVFFNVLGRGVATPANIVITLSNITGTRTVTVTKGGEIN